MEQIKILGDLFNPFFWGGNKKKNFHSRTFWLITDITTGQVGCAASVAPPQPPLVQSWVPLQIRIAIHNQPRKAILFISKLILQ